MSETSSTMKWRVDIADFKQAISDAKREIRLANAEFKTATGGAKDWGQSVDGVKAKIDQLQKVLQSQQTILGQLEKEYSTVSSALGEDSTQAQNLKVQIENQKAAISATSTELGTYTAKLNELETAAKADSSELGTLSKTIGEQESRLSSLKDAYKNAVLQYGENSKEAKSLGHEITSLSGELKENKEKMTEVDTAADKLDKSLEDVGKEASNTKDGFTVFKGMLANLGSQAVTAAISLLKDLGKAIIDTGKAAVQSYADYEQLSGGVEKLFDNSADIIQGYAETAYKTVGLSANEYLETVTGFSASLIGSLGGDTEKAAQYADLALRDMSDNANTFGTDMASVKMRIRVLRKPTLQCLIT